MQSMNVETKAYIFCGVTALFTALYAFFAILLFYKTRFLIEAFSKRIIFIYLFGFLGKRTA